MPLLRSRMRVHRARIRFSLTLATVVAAWTACFAALLIGHYFLGWW